MEQEFPCSPDTSLEIPSIIEAISSSIDDSHFNFDELEQSIEEASTTTESDYMEVEGSWPTPLPQQPDQYNQNYYQNYQPQQQQNWNYQQGCSQYPQYGYMTPSPYNSYYMESPPVDYHHNYAYNTNMMTNYEQQQQPQQQQSYIFNGSQNLAANPQGTEYTCSICIRTFKSSSNLTRHYVSKTHLKRLESKRLNSKVNTIRTKKPRVNGIGSSFTDISKDERAFLWQLDDEIFQFLEIYEQEKASNEAKQNLALPTPPLSPNSRAIEDRKFNGPQSNSNLMKTESVITIASSSENLQASPLSVSSSSVESVDQSPKMEDSENIEANIKDEVNETANLSPESGKSEILASNFTDSENLTSNDVNCDNITSSNANLGNMEANRIQTSDITSTNIQNNAESSNSLNIDNLTSNIVQSDAITSKDIQNSNITLNNTQNNDITSHNTQNSNITSNSTNFDVITVNSEQLSNITSNNQVTRTPAISQPCHSNEYQSNLISTNLTSEFSNMNSINHDYGDQFVNKEPQMTFKTDAQPLTYENSANVTPNYENHYSPNPHQSYYNTNLQTSNNRTVVSHGSNYQQAISHGVTNSMNSGHITSNYVNTGHMNATNAGYNSTNANGYISSASPVHQNTNHVLVKNITSKPNINTNNVNVTSKSINQTSNNVAGIKVAANNTKSSSITQKYQTVTNLLTSGSKPTANQTSNSQNHLQTSNKPPANRIITINPSALTKTSTTTTSGLKITSINPNLTSNNGGAKNPTTYTLTSSNSGIRYLNATNLIGNNVKIQQISPNGIKNFRIVNNTHQALQNKVKIPHAGYNVQQNSPSSPSNGQNSPSHAINSPKHVHNASNSPNHIQNSPSHVQSTENQQQVDQNCEKTPSRQAEAQFAIPNSPNTPSSPTVLIQQETGEKYEIIFSDENFGDNLS